MIKTFTAALVMGAAALASAQAPAAAPAARAPRIAVIDMGRISSESALGKSYASQLETLRKGIEDAGNKKQAELDKLENDIRTMATDLEKQGSVLSAEGADRKRQEIVTKQRARQAFLEDGQAELQRMKDKAAQQAQGLNNEFQTKVKPQIEAIAKERGYDILIDSSVALTVSTEFDISQEVVARLDKAVPARAAAAPAPAKKP